MSAGLKSLLVSLLVSLTAPSNLPAAELPAAAEKLPAAAEKLPAAAEKLPAAAEKLPAAAEKLPAAAASAPAAAEGAAVAAPVVAASPTEERIAAILELAAKGEAAAGSQTTLRDALGDADPDTRAAAAYALGRLRLQPAETLPALVNLFGDEGVAPRGRVLGLAMLPAGDPPARGSVAPREMLEDNENGEIGVWLVAALAVGGYGEAAVPHLLRALDSERKQVVLGGLAGIIRAGASAKATVPRLMILLETDDDDLRRRALDALRSIGADGVDAVPACVKLLEHADFHTRYWACRALGAMGERALPAVEPLIRHMSTPDADVTSVRHNAAEALGNIGPGIGEAGARALIGALADPFQPVRQKAVAALGKLGPLAAPAIPEIEQRLRDAGTPLGEGGKFRPQGWAARTLWKLQPASRLVLPSLLLDLEQDDDPWDAIAVLGEIGPQIGAIPALIDLLDSDAWPSRVNAALALGAMGPAAQAAVPTLEKHRDDPHEEVRNAVADSLQSILGNLPTRP